jgi:hypothetical protein
VSDSFDPADSYAVTNTKRSRERFSSRIQDENQPARPEWKYSRSAGKTAMNAEVLIDCCSTGQQIIYEVNVQCLNVLMIAPPAKASAPSLKACSRP